MGKEKTIRIQGSKDSWFKEAIFIVKPDNIMPYSYRNLQDKADMIIGNYAKKNGLEGRVKREGGGRSLDRNLNLLLVISIIILAICLCMVF